MGILEDSKQRFLAAKNQRVTPEESERTYHQIYRELCSQAYVPSEKLERRTDI